MEIWKAVVGFEGKYEVSNLGRVRRRRKVFQTKPHKTSGYVRLTLRLDGRKYYRDTHRLVLEAFVGPCPTGKEACHGDGNRANNRLDNLRWDTHEHNALDMVQHGTCSFLGKPAWNRVLDAETVEWVRAWVKSGFSKYSVAKAMGISWLSVTRAL